MSGVSSIGAGQTSTMEGSTTPGPQQSWGVRRTRPGPQQSCGVWRTRPGPQQSRGVWSTRLACTKEVHVQLFPHCYKMTTIILVSPGKARLRDKGATTAFEGVEAEPHSYFQLRSGGAKAESDNP
ncbi:hypothetical protein Tco_0012877 [Tanacetum coccineum]